MLFSIGLNSCSNDEPSSKDSYYVKYEVKTTSQYYYSDVTIQVTTENGVEKKVVSRDWEGTFGPISKETPIILNVTHDGQYYVIEKSSFNGRISISKNNSPFVLKAENSSNGKPLNMTYTIDF